MGLLRAARAFLTGVMACAAIVFFFGSREPAAPLKELARLSVPEIMQTYAESHRENRNILSMVSIGSALGLVGVSLAEMARQRREGRPS
ncbi:hypothetical protein HHL28_00360 [Aerophototrophica crusticola]|uniref:Uncharacterized protein n=1 Tax=Aerophototrophica crusticola TaxID=1709002 RepID=A0A858R303_9PROT|nr:hypothetical protein HHL28_00360 [Rhodospirillaceae bacterium B3]